MLLVPSDAVRPTPRERPMTTACAHCGQEVPAGLVDHSVMEGTGTTEQFCCHGCRTARHLITTCGLGNYYELMQRLQDQPARATIQGASERYAEYDHPEFLKLHTRPLDGGFVEVELVVDNMHCAACVWLLEKLPGMTPGVRRSTVRMHGAQLAIEFDPAVIPLSRLANLLQSVGYPVHPARGASSRQLRAGQDRRQLMSIAIAGALMGNIMMFAFVLYGGYFVGIEPAYQALFRWLSMVLGVASLLGPGLVFFRSAWSSIRMRSLNLDVPICTALLVGGVMGVVNTILARGEMYFDSLSMLVFLLLVGRFIQQRQQRWASDEVELLFNITPAAAHVVLPDGATREVPASSLKIDDVVEARAGDSIPADGVVIIGETSIDTAILTGESRPMRSTPGDPVFAGAVNIAAPVRVRVKATGRDTRAAKLMKMVADGVSRRPRVLRFTDRVASWFVVGTSLAATATFVAWRSIDTSLAVDHATSMLIVTCPCVLGLAAPLVMAVAIGRGARRGVMVKGADVLELLSQPGTVVLDKTGTLTEGRCSVVSYEGDADLLCAAAALERCSSHPIATAIVRHASSTPERVQEIEDLSVCDAVQTLGGGIVGTVGLRRLCLGSAAFVASCGYQSTDEQRALIEEALGQGQTPVVLAADGVVAGVYAIGDPARVDSAAAVAALKRRGWRVEMLSGDDQRVALAVARQVGIDDARVFGSHSPEQKLARVQALAAAGERVMMVGDGVNDAAALAAASVGVAVHRGAEASLAAADVYLARPGLSPVVELLDASSRAMRAVHVTLWASLAYNLVAAALTLLGLIHPMIAALIMPLSSLTMLAIALRWHTFDMTTAAEPVGAGRDRTMPEAGAFMPVQEILP